MFLSRKHISFLLIIMGICWGSLGLAQEKPLVNWSELLLNVRTESAQLLLINDQLNVERSRLEDEMAVLRNKILIQESVNQKIQDDIQSYQWDQSADAKIKALKKHSQAKQKAIEQKKAMLSRTQKDTKEMERKVNRQQLQVQKLELEKANLLESIKNKAQGLSGGHKTELQLLQEQMYSQQAQEQHIRSRIEALKSKRTQNQNGSNMDAMKTFDLRKRLAELEKQKTIVLDQIAQIKSTQDILLRNKIVAKIRILLDQKKALEEKMMQLDSQQKGRLTEPKEIATMLELLNNQIKESQRQNQQLKREIENAQDNIRVLEQQITSIQYQHKK